MDELLGRRWVTEGTLGSDIRYVCLPRQDILLVWTKRDECTKLKMEGTRAELDPPPALLSESPLLSQPCALVSRY